MVCNELHEELIRKKYTVNKLTLNTSQKLRADEMCDGVRRQVFVLQAGEGLINKNAKQWSK